MAEDVVSFVENCRSFLRERWNRIVQSEAAPINFSPELSQHWSSIKQILGSKTKSYHYVLPTQLLAKCVNPDLDCRSLQAAFSSPGAFDARTIAHEVIVPFDQENYKVLGGSPEPYVNNPLRYPAVISDYRGPQKNKEDWDVLTALLQEVENQNNAGFTLDIFDCILTEISELLTEVAVVYPTPNRISLNDTLKLIHLFTNEKSGGDRLETIVTAIFRTIGKQFGIYDRVERSKVNASDASTGLIADIECWNKEKIIIGIEVKDKTLTITQFENTINTARANKISEILFIAEKGIESGERELVENRLRQEFSSGQNIYIQDFSSFAAGILILFGEKGRVEFLHEVGPELDRVNSAILHRKHWAELLRMV